MVCRVHPTGMGSRAQTSTVSISTDLNRNPKSTGLGAADDIDAAGPHRPGGSPKVKVITDLRCKTCQAGKGPGGTCLLPGGGCLGWCSLSGLCGTGDDHQNGTDCRGYLPLPPTVATPRKRPRGVKSGGTFNCAPVSRRASIDEEAGCWPSNCTDGCACRRCDTHVAVMEVYGFHDETMPTMGLAMEAAGRAHNLSTCVTIIDMVAGRREDLFDVLQEQGLRTKILTGRAAVEHYLRNTMPAIIAVNTIDDYASTHAFHTNWLDTVAGINPTQKIIAGCHRPATCLQQIEIIRRRAPTVRVTPQVFHPAARDTLIASASKHVAPELAEARKKELAEPGAILTSVPFFFGTRALPAETVPSERHDRVNILVVGKLAMGGPTTTKKIRSIESIVALQNVTLIRPVHLIIFGGATSDEVKDHLMAVFLDNSQVTFEFTGGPWATLFQFAEKAAFVAPLIDTSSTGHCAYVNGKLTSSMAVAQGFLLPVIGSKDLIFPYGLTGQLAHDIRGGAFFAEAVETAVSTCANTQQPNLYDQMRAAQCDFVEDHFSATAEHIAAIFGREMSEKATGLPSSTLGSGATADNAWGIEPTATPAAQFFGLWIGDSPIQASRAERFEAYAKSLHYFNRGARLWLFSMAGPGEVSAKVGNGTIYHVHLKAYDEILRGTPAETFAPRTRHRTLR